MASIRSDLDTYWPSLNGPATSFWSHEWSKHGTCAENVLSSQLKYFSAALALRQQYDPIAALAAAGIVPSNTASFTLTQLNAALASSYGQSSDAVVSCDANGNIEEIAQCFTPSLAAMPCPSNASPGACSSADLFLPTSISR